MFSSYESKPLGTARVFAEGLGKHTFAWDSGPWAPGLQLADLPASHRALLDVQLPAVPTKHWLFPRLQAFANIVSSAENTPPSWPGKIPQLPALHFSSGDEGSHGPGSPAEAPLRS